MKIEGTESKRVTEVLSWHECTLEHQLSHNAFVPVYANVCRHMKSDTLYSAGRIKFSPFECNEVWVSCLFS